MARVKLLFFLGLMLCFSQKHAIAQNVKAKQKPSISELLINSTVKIESVGDTIKNGTLVPFESTGTAFYYELKVDSITMPVLVTNFHVIKNTSLTRIVFTKADNAFAAKKGDLVEYDNFNFENRWIKHPLYDLAILPLLPIMMNLKKSQLTNIFYTPFVEANVPPDSIISSLSAIENLLMIGYPKGYWDSKNNYPIVRRGTTATPIYSNFDDKNEFLLDVPIYSGSSGSPVVLLNEGSYSVKGNLIAGNRLFLLGIATQSIDLKRSDGIADSGNDNPLNIAIVIKASALNYFKTALSDFIKQHPSLKTVHN